MRGEDPMLARVSGQSNAASEGHFSGTAS